MNPDRAKDLPPHRGQRSAAAAVLAGGRSPAVLGDEPSTNRWRKAFMLGGRERGLPPGRLPAPEGGGLRGRRAHQPQPARSPRGPRGARPDGAGHPRRQRLAPLARHALRPRPPGRRARDGRHPPGIRRLQGLWRHHRAGRPGRRQQEGRLSRRLQALPGQHPQADPRRREARRSRSPSRRSGTSSCSARSSSPATSTSSRAPGSAPISTWATSSSSATPRSGSASWASGSSRSTSRSTPSRSGSTTAWAKGRRSTGPPSRSALVEVGYEGWITAEVPFGNLDQMKDVVPRMDRLLPRA